LSMIGPPANPTMMAGTVEGPLMNLLFSMSTPLSEAPMMNVLSVMVG
jgi:hypothetical protein